MCQQLCNFSHILNVHKINTAYTKYILIGRVKYFKSRPVESDAPTHKRQPLFYTAAPS